MELLVFGAGVLGTLYAARLAQAGEAVTILARGPRAEAIRERGLVLAGEAPVRVPVVERPDPEAGYDAVLVLVRRDQVDAARPLLAEARGAKAFVFMVNDAAGPARHAEVLGRARICLGFAGAGGRRAEDGEVEARVLPRLVQPTTLGECEGPPTARLRVLGRALRRAGFPVAYSPRMDTWLKTHAAVVVPAAFGVYRAGGSSRGLAASRALTAQVVDAVREGTRALEALGTPPEPPRLRRLLGLPRSLLVPMVRRALDTARSELVVAHHAVVARSELEVLAADLVALVQRAGTPAPALLELVG